MPIPKKETQPQVSIELKQKTILKNMPIPKKEKALPIPTEPKQKTIPKTTTYRYAGKETFFQTIANTIPKQFTPTNRISKILGFIFLAIIVIAIMQFPFKESMSGDLSIVVKVGYPLSFLEFRFIDTGESPLKIKGFALDLILYLILAYIIDITINLLTDTKLLKTKEDLKKQPILFKKPEPSIAEKVTKEIIKEKPIPPNMVNQKTIKQS